MFKSTLLRSLFLLDPLFSLFLLFGILVGMAKGETLWETLLRPRLIGTSDSANRSLRMSELP
jgi:hypothetical protein